MTLKNCPFCDSDSITLLKSDEGSEFNVYCVECQAMGPETVDENMAVKAWNDRSGITTEEFENNQPSNLIPYHIVEAKNLTDLQIYVNEFLLTHPSYKPHGNMIVYQPGSNLQRFIQTLFASNQ